MFSTVRVSAVRSVLLVAMAALVPAWGSISGHDESVRTPRALFPWGTAGLIEAEIGHGLDPQVAVDSSGNVTAVWQQQDGTGSSIMANRYETGVGWGTPVFIEPDSAGDALVPQVAVDSDGNATAVWAEYTSGVSSIWSNRYEAGVGWGTAMMIEAEIGHGLDPQVAVDSSGNVTAVWQQQDGTGSSIMSNRYEMGVGWGTPVHIEPDSAGDALVPQLAVDADGNATVVWAEYTSGVSSIWSNRYEVGVGWGTAMMIEAVIGHGLDPQVAVDPDGNVTAVWQQQDGTGASIMSNRYEVGVGWGTPVYIEPDSAGDSLVPQVAVDSSGNATAVWAEYTSGVSSIWSNRYEAGVGWGTAMMIEAEIGHGLDPQVAIDSTGNATTVVWQQQDGTGSSIMSNRYEMGVGWGTPAFIEPDSAGDALVPQVAVDSDGNATVVWAEYTSGVSSIWSNRFDFIPLVVNLPDPTGLAQFLSDGTTPLSTGGTARGPVILSAMTDNPGGATRLLLVEIRPTAQPFSGDPVRAGATSTTDALTVGFSSPVSASYHWRARVFEPDTRSLSNWVAFGSNDDPMDPTDPNGATDFDVTLGVGGPDAFGYTYADDRALNGPVYAMEFEDITATGTAMTFQAYSSWPATDEGQFEAPLGFSFSFYGNTYTTTWVNTNGFVKFGSSTVSGTNGELAYQATTLPSTQQPNIVAVKWGDRTGVLGWYETRGTAPDRRFIVHWIVGGQTYQVKLYENGQIILVHVTGNSGGETAGIQNDTGTIGLLYSYTGSPETIVNQRSIRFVPPPPPPAPAPSGGGGSSGRCGSVGVDLMAPLVLLALWRRFKRRGRRELFTEFQERFIFRKPIRSRLT